MGSYVTSLTLLSLLLLQKLGALSFLPADRSQASSKAAEMDYVHPAVKNRLGDVLLAAAKTFTALHTSETAAPLYERLSAILAFSNQLHGLQLSNEVYQQLSSCHARF
jgi:hypothetical protein